MTDDEKTIAIEIAAEKVAALWAEQLCRPFNKDNGDDNPLLFMITTMNTRTAQESISESSLATFKSGLVTAIKDEFSTMRTTDYLTLSTDYQPELILTKAAIDVGINIEAFPWKSYTSIYLSKGKVDYRFGYSANFQSIPI